jgi:hypothetical protein
MIWKKVYLYKREIVSGIQTPLEVVGFFYISTAFVIPWPDLQQKQLF